MSVALKRDRVWTAEDFLATDQHAFGDAWRYELVDGVIVAHAASAPDHGAIIAGLTTALGNRIGNLPRGCRPEVGSGAVPRRQQRNTARIPDVMIRCGERPRTLFEVVSPSDLGHPRVWTRRRHDLQATEGVLEIVEIMQAEPVAHVYHRAPDGTWTFEGLDGTEAVLRLDSLSIDLPMAEIYRFTDLSDADSPAA